MRSELSAHQAKHAKYVNPSPKESMCGSPALWEPCYAAVAEIYTVLRVGVPVLIPSGVLLVLSTQLWGSLMSEGLLLSCDPSLASEGPWPHKVK